MTPDELRSLADQATRDPRWWQGDEEARPGFEQLEAGNELVAIAPALARLCADMANALGFLTHPSVYGVPKWRQKAAHAALAKLSELNSGADEPPARERT